MKTKSFFQSLSEGETNFYTYNTNKEKGPGKKSDAPFYNKAMELNRDLSVVFCQNLINSNKKELRFLDGLASSGVRGFRLANELTGDFEVTINDWDLNAFDLIKKNFELFNFDNVLISNENLNVLLSSDNFDYIDIDPFGSPAYFIDSAIRSINNNGVIACTATDTATLCGVYPKTCIRRYGAVPFHSEVMKEVGLRILLGFICRIAGFHDKAIQPLISYCTDHYFRVYVKINKGAKKANKSIEKIKTIEKDNFIGIKKTDKEIGPLWMGNIQDKKSIKEIRTTLFEKELKTKNQLWKILDLLEEEADSPIFYYTTNSISKILKKSPPKMSEIFEKISMTGHIVTKTHFNPAGFKTDMPLSDIKNKIFK